ncbi:hypothetical protein M9Y10_000164 [Tritrichomonas musculus]|uniref:Protein kinase domain-containing protein n=1 Tax=Tritrichomonas musculus TaxID=1915356 RepID=A0ABR2L4L2_9EUKA
MSTSEIVNKIKQVIQDGNSAFIFTGQCALIIKILTELQNKISEIPESQFSNMELAICLEQLDKIINSFKSDQWDKIILTIPISQSFSNLTEVMTSIEQTLQKLNITLENNYTVLNETLANDLKSLSELLSDSSQFEETAVKRKLKEIEEYLIEIGYPLDPNSQLIQSKNIKKEKNGNEEQNNDQNPDTTSNDTKNKNEFNNAGNTQSYQIKLSDYNIISKENEFPHRYIIYKGLNKTTSEEVTIMIINQDTKNESKFQRLVNILTTVCHPNLESFIGVDRSQYAVVTRRNGQKLHDFIKTIKNNRKSSIEQNQEKEDLISPGYKTIIAYKIAAAMAYLHSLDITHRDLCTVNIFVDDSFNPKIANFANSRFLPADTKTMSKRPSSITKFKAPEFSSNEEYGREIDVFSFSGILYELLTEKEPFEGYSSSLIEKKIANKERPILPTDISPDLSELIVNCWRQKPSERPTFSEIIDTMMTKRIAFPDEQDSPIVRELYDSKSVKNKDIRECMNLLKEINENIQNSIESLGMYSLECSRVSSLLWSYHYMLETSSYATKPAEEDPQCKNQLMLLKDYLEDLKNVAEFLIPDNWVKIAFSNPAADITTDIYDNMAGIYDLLVKIKLPVTKYEYVNYDLVNDYRKLYDFFSYYEVTSRMDEIVNFLHSRGLEIIKTKDEINEIKKNFMKHYKDYKLNRDDFELGEKIGTGASSIVYECIKKSTGEKFACKEINDEFIFKEELNLTYLRREICFLIHLKNKFLMKFVGFNFDVGKPLWIVSEHISGGDLFKANKRETNPLTSYQKTKIALEIAQGMEYLHSNRIIHRDLKTSNILIDSNDNSPKISDFGFSKTNISLSMTKGVGTPNYMAPEVIEGKNYSFGADVFSFGMILWELYSGDHPYMWPKRMRRYKSLKQIKLPYSKPIHDDLNQLIAKCIDFTPSKRPSFKQIIEMMIEKKIAYYDTDSNGIIASEEYKNQIDDFYNKKKEELETEEANDDHDDDIQSLLGSLKH